jgi:hypothetical protein
MFSALALLALVHNPASAMSGVPVMMTSGAEFTELSVARQRDIVVVVGTSWRFDRSDIISADRSGAAVEIVIDPADLPTELVSIIEPSFLEGEMVGIIDPDFLLGEVEALGIIEPSFHTGTASLSDATDLVGIIEPSFLTADAWRQLDRATSTAGMLGIIVQDGGERADSVITVAGDELGIINPDSM